MTDIEIARSINPKDITEVAKTLGIENKIELYGSNKAKISLDLLKQIVFHSDLTESYIEKERGIIQNEIARRPEYIKDYNFNSKIYDGFLLLFLYYELLVLQHLY
jgi:hypothetical protein